MDRYKKIFWLFLGALMMFIAGNIAGKAVSIREIMTDCDYMSKFRVGKTVYECRSDFSYLSQKPKTGGK